MNKARKKHVFSYNTRQSLLTMLVLGALALPAAHARGAILTVEDVLVSYATQTPASATGTLTFNIRFNDLDGDPGNYDFFSAQMMVSRILGAPSGTLTLNEVVTEDTGPIGPMYWLPNPPTSFQNASTQGAEFRFSDFVSINQAIMPLPGDILAHYVINFELTSADQFGEYEIAAGSQAFNHFRSDLFNTFENTIAPAPIVLIPEASTGLLLCFVAVALLRRRR